MLYIEYPLPICLWGYFIIIEVLMKIKISPRGGFEGRLCLLRTNNQNGLLSRPLSFSFLLYFSAS